MGKSKTNDKKGKLRRSKMESKSKTKEKIKAKVAKDSDTPLYKKQDIERNKKPILNRTKEGKIKIRKEKKISIDQKQVTFAREERRKFEMERQYLENLFEYVDNDNNADYEFESVEILEEEDPIVIEL
jgi:hypothetical protein